MAFRRSMTKIAASESGSISQRYGSADPDPQHCFVAYRYPVPTSSWVRGWGRAPSSCSPRPGRPSAIACRTASSPPPPPTWRAAASSNPSLWRAPSCSPSHRQLQWNAGEKVFVQISVPDPDPPNPQVFGPPRSGSISQRYGSGSFYHQAKIVRKTLIPTALWLLLNFLSFKNDVNIPSKSNKQKNFFFKLVFCWRLEGQWRK